MALGNRGWGPASIFARSHGPDRRDHAQAPDDRLRHHRPFPHCGGHRRGRAEAAVSGRVYRHRAQSRIEAKTRCLKAFGERIAASPEGHADQRRIGKMPRGSRAFSTLAGFGRSIASPSQARRFAPFFALARPSSRAQDRSGTVIARAAAEPRAQGRQHIPRQVRTAHPGACCRQPMLEAATEPMVRVRSSLRHELAGL